MRISEGNFCSRNRNEELILEAYGFAKAAHESIGQVRKYTKEPYINHPVEVMEILWDCGIRDPEVMQAALLHDVVEETRFSLVALWHFGKFVRGMVGDLTDISLPHHGNRAERKRIDRDHISRGMPSSKTIKLADMISNSRSIVKHDPKFAKVYLPEKRLLLSVLKEGDQRLWDECDKILKGHGY